VKLAHDIIGLGDKIVEIALLSPVLPRTDGMVIRKRFPDRHSGQFFFAGNMASHEERSPRQRNQRTAREGLASLARHARTIIERGVWPTVYPQE
jgi:hypothetical protein